MKSLISRIIFGFVERFKARQSAVIGGYATIIVPELGNRQLTASVKCGPQFVTTSDDSDVPVFDPNIRLSGAPLPTDEVVLEVTEVNGRATVIAWGFAKFWRKSEQEIAKRPYYRVVRENRFKGQTMAGPAHSEVVVEGSLSRIIEVCPRDGLLESTVDQFAPVYRTGPITAKNHFELRNANGTWVPCDDPRPFPLGPLFRIMLWKDDDVRQLGCGTALELNWKFPRGKNDPLEQYRTSGESEGYLYFERRQVELEFGGEKTITWAEVNDPRPLPIEKKSSRPAASVAPPKSNKPRVTVLTNLADLQLA